LNEVDPGATIEELLHPAGIRDEAEGLNAFHEDHTEEPVGPGLENRWHEASAEPHIVTLS
jgi:hypothetical protein